MMVRRLAWFAAGAAAGLGGSVWARHKVRDTATRLSPKHLAETAVEAVVGAVREGRDAMRAKEVELRAVRDGHPATMTMRVRPLHVVVDSGPDLVELAGTVELRPASGGPGPRRHSRR